MYLGNVCLIVSLSSISSALGNRGLSPELKLLLQVCMQIYQQKTPYPPLQLDVLLHNCIHWLQVLFLDFWVVSGFLMDADDPAGVGGVLIVIPKLPWKLDLRCVGIIGGGDLLIVTPVLFWKLALGPGLADDPVRLLVVSSESRAIFWGSGLVGGASKPVFNCTWACLFGRTLPRGWICGGSL